MRQFPRPAFDWRHLPIYRMNRFCVMTPGREHEIEVARGQRYEPDSILTFDRAYVDYHWFDQLHRQGVYFVTRQKRNARYRVLERRPVGSQPGVTSDQVIRLTGKAAQCLSTPLRRIGYRDPETRQFYVFLTNLFHLRAGEVAAIYKARWQIELFFKWVKQHLKIKSFLGTTANAVMTQVWVALCVYLLVAYVKFLLRPPGRLYEIFKRLQVTALEYLALGQVLAREAKNGPKRAPKWRRSATLYRDRVNFKSGYESNRPLFVTVKAGRGNSKSGKTIVLEENWQLHNLENS